MLLLALVTHLLIQPFRNMKLNYLEAASLVVSSLTFYGGLLFNDPNTSEVAEIVISVVIIVLIISFITVGACQVRVHIKHFR